jgi:hypothetical protein
VLIGNVSDTFEIKERGLILATDRTYEQLPKDLKLKVGDSVELRRDGVVVFRTAVTGIELCDPWSPNRLFAFLLPRGVTKADVPIGAEVWTVE